MLLYLGMRIQHIQLGRPNIGSFGVFSAFVSYLIDHQVSCPCLDNENFLDALHLLINEMFDKGKYPLQLKTELVKPIHKKQEIHFKKNYRGISLTSCLSKFINNLLLSRLSKCFEELNLSKDNMMGFRPSMRTSNNKVVLKTLIDKQFHKNLCTCFVDFSKAFDTIWRKGLIAKLNSFGIEGKMLNIIKDLYSGHVTVGEFMSDNFKISFGVKQGLSDNFKIPLGVKQGDPPSPFFFNIYMEALCTNLLKIETEASIINDNKVPCLFYYFLEICLYCNLYCKRNIIVLLFITWSAHQKYYLSWTNSMYLSEIHRPVSSTVNSCLNSGKQASSFSDAYDYWNQISNTVVT